MVETTPFFIYLTFFIILINYIHYVGYYQDRWQTPHQNPSDLVRGKQYKVMSIAIIKTGGKQYKVSSGRKIKIEKLEGNEGDAVTLGDVLLMAGDKEVKIGQPKVEDAKVTAKILKQDRAKKVIILKFKPKKRYQVKRGHRQPYTLIEIENIK
jgi:large subunit ribosomal protein L21